MQVVNIKEENPIKYLNFNNNNNNKKDEINLKIKESQLQGLKDYSNRDFSKYIVHCPIFINQGPQTNKNSVKITIHV